MEYQLIISRKDKFRNIAYPKDAMEKYIIDYSDLSSMHLKKQKCFIYRVLAIDRVLIGKELRQTFNALLEKEKACYYVDIDEFVKKGTQTEREIESHITEFAGVLYENY